MPSAPTQPTPTNDTSVATTAFVRNAIAAYAPLPDLSNYVTLNGTQTITGAKTFTAPTGVTAASDLAGAGGWFEARGGAIDETVGIASTRMTGNRLQFRDGTNTPWQIDTNTNNLRLFKPGSVKATFDSGGGLTIPGQFAGGSLSVSGNVQGAGLVISGGGSFGAVVTAATPNIDNNSTQLATTAYVISQGATTNPVMNGVAAPGTSTRWAHADHVHPVDTSRQPADADLTAISNLNTTGLATRTATDTWATRSIAGTAGQINVTSGDGVSGNPTISLPATITQATTFSAGLTSTTINATTGYQVAGVALAAIHLSNGVTGTGAVMLAASPTTTGTLTAAAITMSGDLRLAESRHISLTRSIPPTVGDTVDIGTFFGGNGAQSFRISLVISDAGFSVTKLYDFAVQYDQAGASGGGWRVVRPISSTGSYGNNDVQLEASWSSGDVTFRIRRLTGTTTNATARLSIINSGQSGGGNTFTPSSTVTSAPAPVTAALSSTPLSLEANLVSAAANVVAGGSIRSNAGRDSAGFILGDLVNGQTADLRLTAPAAGGPDVKFSGVQRFYPNSEVMMAQGTMTDVNLIRNQNGSMILQAGGGSGGFLRTFGANIDVLKWAAPGSNDGVTIQPYAAAGVVLTVNGAASQSGDLQQWKVNGTMKAYLQATGRLSINGEGLVVYDATPNNPRATLTAAGLTFGPGGSAEDVKLYRNAQDVLKTDDRFQIAQIGTFASGDINTYALAMFDGATGQFSVGDDATNVYVQSWNNKPLRINSQGNLVYIDNGLNITNGLTVAGAISFPVGSINGTAIANGTIPVGAIGFAFGAGNRLYNSSFESSGVVGDGTTAVPYFGWTLTNATATTVGVNAGGADALRVIHGTAALKLTSVAAGNYSVLSDTTRAVVTGGTPYVASAYVGGTVAGKSATVSIDWYTAASAFISTSTSAALTLPTAAMARVNTGVVNSPATASYARVRVQGTAAGAGEIMYIDGVQLEDNVLTGYAPSPSEIIPGTITSNLILAGAVTAQTLAVSLTITGKRIETAVTPNPRVTIEGDAASEGERGIYIYGLPTNGLTPAIKRVALTEDSGIRMWGKNGTLGLKLADTGGLMMGSPTGARVLYDENGISAYDSTPTLRTKVDTGGLKLYDTSGTLRITLSTTGGLTTTGAGGTVRVDDSGVYAYNSTAILDNTTQTVAIDRANSKFIVGSPVAARMEADRNSIRFYDAASVQTFSIISGVLTTGTADSGARVRIDNNSLDVYDATQQRVTLDTTSGLTLKDTAGSARVQLSSTGGLKTTGGSGAVILDDSGLTAYTSPTTLDSTTQSVQIARAAGMFVAGVPTGQRMEADRTSIRFFTSTNAVNFSVINGVLTTGSSDSNARVRMDNVGIQAFVGTTKRVQLDGTTGLTLYDTAGTSRSTINAEGGLTLAATTGSTTRIDVDYNGIDVVAAGVTRVSLNSTDGLKLNDTSGTTRAWLSAGGGLRLTSTFASTSYLDLSDAGLIAVNAGVERVRLDVASGLTLKDSAGTARAWLSGNGGLTLASSSGSTTRMDLDYSSIVSYASNVPKVAIDTTNGIRLFDSAGNARAWLNGSGGLQLAATSGNSSRLEADYSGFRTYIGNVLRAEMSPTVGFALRDSGGNIAVSMSATGGFTSNSGTGRVELNWWGLRGFDSAGNNTVNINTDGTISLTGVGRITATSLNISTGGMNLIRGGRPDVDSSGWASFQSTIGTAFNVGPSGQGVYTVTSTTAGAAYLYRDGVGGPYNARVLPGSKVTISGLAKVISGAVNHTAYFEMRWGNGTFTSSPGTVITNSAWTRLSYTFTVPTAATYTGYSFLTTGAAGVTVHWTDLQLEQGDLVTEWKPFVEPTVIDGSTITGALIRTGSTGARVQLDNTGFMIYNSSNALLARMNTDMTTGTLDLYTQQLTDGDPDVTRRIRWMDTSGTSAYGELFAYEGVGGTRGGSGANPTKNLVLRTSYSQISGSYGKTSMETVSPNYLTDFKYARIFTQSSNGSYYVGVEGGAAFNKQFGFNIMTVNLNGVSSDLAFNDKSNITFIGFHAWRTTTDTSNTSGWQLVQMEAEEWDVNNWHTTGSGTKFQPTRAGYYRFSINVYFDLTSAGDETLVAIYKNGSEYRRGTQNTSPNGNDAAQHLDVIVYLNGTTDYVQPYRYTNVGRWIAGGYTWWQGEFLGV
jgi:hypothetical protein